MQTCEKLYRNELNCIELNIKRIMRTQDRNIKNACPLWVSMQNRFHVNSVNWCCLCFPCQGEEKIQMSDHYNTFERSGMHFLEICQVCSDDAGIYTCLVSNSAGKASATAELIVQGNRISFLSGLLQQYLL